MCLDELSFGGMLKRCGLLRGGRHCGGRDGVTPLMFAARTELTLHRTNRFGNSSRFERRSSAAYAGRRDQNARQMSAVWNSYAISPRSSPERGGTHCGAATRTASSLKASSTPPPVRALLERTDQPARRRASNSVLSIAHWSCKSFLFKSRKNGRGPCSSSSHCRGKDGRRSS